MDKYPYFKGYKPNFYFKVKESEIRAEPIEKFELSYPSKRLKEASNIMADLMFAYVNKDGDSPHQFEIEAMEHGLYFLQEFYNDGKYTTKFFEEIINRMYPEEG